MRLDMFSIENSWKVNSVTHLIDQLFLVNVTSYKKQHKILKIFIQGTLWLIR